MAESIRNLPDYKEEASYLERTKKVLTQTLAQEKSAVSGQYEDVLEAKREFLDNAMAGKYMDANQYLESIQMKASTQQATAQRIKRYEDSMDSPYFARVDFKESGYPTEKIYIGLHSVSDEENYETYVYDWRAPVSSIFYRYELGPAEYAAPMGMIKGEISKKRQYEIKKGELRYYFDSSINIQDEILRDVLSHNASPQMKSIVETIQRQQDEIIRDTDHELLMVQGVAGSGKTSVALHRIAYLMYQGLNQSLNAQNVIILSPNALFGRYIANVLPELGEESILSVTFEEIFRRNVHWDGTLETKNDFIEALTSSLSDAEKTDKRERTAFFASPEFCKILGNYLSYIKAHIPFEDIYYNGKIMMNRRQMSDFLYSSNRTVPVEKALQLISNRIWDAIHLERKERMEKLVAFYRPTNEHRYDYRQYARYTSIRESTRLKHRINAFTTLNYPQLFRQLLTDRTLFRRMAKGISLPHNWELHLDAALSAMDQKKLEYGASLALMYLKQGLAGGSYPHIKQVVVDEAQDYYPLHFHILGSLFPNARFTVLGDVNQTIEKEASLSIYDDFAKALKKKSSALITLNKGFRCSYEISKFSERFLETRFPVEAFDRHGKEPEIVKGNNSADLAKKIAAAVHSCKEDGCESIAIICKTMERAQTLFTEIKSFVDCKVVSDHSKGISGVSILPLYLAKGLEFDAAILDEVNVENYHSPLDKKLLYVCSTRPLHRLDMFYTGKPSPFLKGE
ncbi:MAG: AAA family ATPase [Oscillospiraceae bacterium]|nr:AAA family ATPase [Oscillospiraceae bacterium]